MIPFNFNDPEEIDKVITALRFIWPHSFGGGDLLERLQSTLADFQDKTGWVVDWPVGSKVIHNDFGWEGEIVGHKILTHTTECWAALEIAWPTHRLIYGRSNLPKLRLVFTDTGESS